MSRKRNRLPAGVTTLDPRPMRPPWSVRLGNAVGGALDACLLPFAPAAVLSRRVNRNKLTMLSTLDAAVRDRLTADWPYTSKSADDVVLPDAPYANARARLAAYNDPWASSLVDSRRRNVVGTGITPVAAIRDPETDEPLDDLSEAADNWWNWWATDPAACDMEHKRTMLMFQRLLNDEWFTVGQGFIILNYIPNGDMVGLRLQACETEQLDTTYDKNENNGNEIRNGIEINQYGAPLAYHFYTTEHPLEGYSTKSTRIAASRVIHLFEPSRVRETHGLTGMHAVLNGLRHFQMYDEYQLIAARGEAIWGAFLPKDPNKTQSQQLASFGLNTGAASDKTDANSNPQVNLSPGMVHVVDQQPLFVQPKRPGEMYEPFTNQQLMKAAAGAGSNYTEITRRNAGTHIAARADRLALWQTTDPLQAIMIDLMMRRIWESFQTYAIREGRWLAPNFGQSVEWRRAYLAVDWQPTAKLPLDEADDAMAYKINRSMGRISLGEKLNERGKNLRKHVKELDHEEQMIEDAGLDVDAMTGRTPDPQGMAPKRQSELPETDEEPPNGEKE